MGLTMRLDRFYGSEALCLDGMFRLVIMQESKWGRIKKL